MPSLLEVQRGLRAALLDDDTVAPTCIAEHDAAERLAIYRGTIYGTLIKALRLSFPTVDHLVGREFFEGAAMLFAQSHVADSPNLDAYGSGFPAFLQDLPQCEHLEYLADVARLDWAVARALHAPEALPLAPEDLAGYLQSADDLRFVPHPSISLLRSAFTIHDIWRAILAQDDDLIAAIDLSAGPVHLIVQRIGHEVEVIALDEREWRFAEALLGGAPLVRALESAPVDVAASLANHLAAGRIVGIGRNHNKDKA